MAQTIREQVTAAWRDYERSECDCPESEDALWRFIETFRKHHADLFAAAQETADERDAIAAYAAQVREALQALVNGTKGNITAHAGNACIPWSMAKRYVDAAESALSLTPPDAVAKGTANDASTGYERAQAALAAKQEGEHDG